MFREIPENMKILRYLNKQTIRSVVRQKRMQIKTLKKIYKQRASTLLQNNINLTGTLEPKVIYSYNLSIRNHTANRMVTIYVSWLMDLREKKSIVKKKDNF